MKQQCTRSAHYWPFQGLWYTIHLAKVPMLDAYEQTFKSKKEKISNTCTLPNIMYAIMTVKRGAEDLIVSENDIATFFIATTEQTTEPNLKK